jgi:hypothetical protein
MAKFLFVYRSPKDARTSMTPEEMQQMLQRWSGWIGEGIQKRWMLDPGDALKREGKVLNANKVIMDGPFVEAKEIVGGFSIVEAPSLEAAAELAKGCPVFQRGGTVEVRQMEGFTINK